MSQCIHPDMGELSGLLGYRCCICGWSWGELAQSATPRTAAIAVQPWSGPPRPATFGPKFYRLCPKDAHTCVDRGCLADNDGLHCPKDKPAEANAPAAAPTINPFDPQTGFTVGDDTCD